MARPPCAGGSGCLMSCPFRTCLRSILCKPLQMVPNPVGPGCVPGPPACSATDAALGLPATFNSGCTISNNHGIVPGLLINSNVSQIQATIFQAHSWYYSLRVRVDNRMSHGFQVG